MYSVWDCIREMVVLDKIIFPLYFILRIYYSVFIILFDAIILSHKLHLKDTFAQTPTLSVGVKYPWEEELLTVVEHLQRCRYVKIIWQPRGSLHPSRGRIYLATFVTALDRSQLKVKPYRVRGGKHRSCSLVEIYGVIEQRFHGFRTLLRRRTKCTG